MLLAMVVAMVPVGAAMADNLVAGSGDTSAYDKQTTKMKVSNVGDRVIENGNYIMEWAGDSQLLVGVEKYSKANKASVVTQVEHKPYYSQVWNFTYEFSSRTYIIKNKRSGKVLTVSGKAKSGSKIIQKKLASKSDKRQRWYLLSTKSGYKIYSAYNKKCVLTVNADVENTVLRGVKNNNKVSQRFWLHKAANWKPGATIRNGVYTLASGGSASTLLLGVPGSLSKPNTRLSVAANSNKLSQMWRFIEVKKPAGYYRIQNISSSLYLTVSGAKVVQSKYKAKNVQLWKPVVVDGGIRLVNRTNKVLDIEGGVANSNSKVSAGAVTAAAATQTWAISPTTTGITYACERGLNKANARAAMREGPYSWSDFKEYYITADLTAFEMNIFKRSDVGKAWVPFKRWSVASGKNKCTTEGDTCIYQKWEYYGDDSGYRAWYWNTIGDTAFHSVLCFKGTKSIKDSRTRGYISEGCIRVGMNNIKWIYYNCPIGTFVSRYY